MSDDLPLRWQVFCSLPEKYRCPVCQNPLVVKQRFDPANLSQCGIIFTCDNWEGARSGECYSEWNKGDGRKTPWHTWIDYVRLMVGTDLSRGGHGKRILESLSQEDKVLHRRIVRLQQAHQTAHRATFGQLSPKQIQRLLARESRMSSAKSPASS